MWSPANWLYEAAILHPPHRLWTQHPWGCGSSYSPLTGSSRLNYGTAVWAVSQPGWGQGQSFTSDCTTTVSALSSHPDRQRAGFSWRWEATSGWLGISPCRRMEIEKRTNGFDYPERNNAKSVNGRQTRPGACSCMFTHARTHAHTHIYCITHLCCLDHAFSHLQTWEHGCTVFWLGAVNASITAAETFSRLCQRFPKTLPQTGEHSLSFMRNGS